MYRLVLENVKLLYCEWVRERQQIVCNILAIYGVVCIKTYYNRHLATLRRLKMNRFLIQYYFLLSQLFRRAILNFDNKS